MLNKIFSYGGGGSKGVMDYMLKEKDKVTPREGITVLRGDVELQAKLIDSLVPQFKQQYVAGCWSFEEAPDQVTEDQKNEIMDGTERLILAGLDPDRVSITWIEHTDKGRLELNYIVACVDLEHGRLFQPYIHSHDKERFNAFRDIQNITHGFTEPLDPAKAKTVSQSDNLPRDTKSLKEVITATLESQVVQGLITNRDDVKQALNELGYTITRAGKDYISIKNPAPDGRNIKFKSNEGGLYDIKFNASAEVASEISRANEDFRGSAKHRLESAQRVFDKELGRKSDYHGERHGRPMRGSGGHDQEVDRSLIKYEDGNSQGLERILRFDEPSPFRRARSNEKGTKRSQDRNSENAARAQRERQHDYQDTSTPLFHISPDSSSFNISVRHPFWARNSKNIKLNEVNNEQTITRSSAASDASAARHNSATVADARSKGSGYSRIDSIIDQVITSANTTSARVTTTFSQLERVDTLISSASSNMVTRPSENTEQSADLDDRAISISRESDKIDKSNDELSERIATLDNIGSRSSRVRERISAAEPFTRANQQAVDKIEHYIEVKNEQDRAERDANTDPIIEAYNKPAVAHKPEPSYPTPFDSPYKPPSPFR